MAIRKSPPRAPDGRAGGFESIPHIRLALISFFVIAAAVFGAVQVLGDPAAAGPRRVLALEPGAVNAEAAARVSFSDAALPGAEITMPDLSYEDGPIHGREPGDAAHVDGAAQAGEGELRIAVVETSQARPQRQPLARAPIAGLTERGPLGLLPIVARDGRQASRVYARPFTDPNRPKIAIVVGGLGFNARNTTQAIEELPPEVTLSFVPYANNLQSWIDRARAAGHEVMLELPMEPFDPEADDTGPQTLMAAANAEQNVARLENLLSRATGYFGVTNYQGGRFAASAQASAPIAQQLRRRGLVFLSSGLGQRSAFTIEAQRAQLPIAGADRIIDARREAEAIDDQLLNLEALALQNGSAIGAGFAFPVTMEQIETWSHALGGRGYVLAPVSAVVQARAQSQAQRR
ncbi:MAG: divergent polysaccharide deacetylase family protein [Hyphomonadaceae bacterium]